MPRTNTFQNTKLKNLFFLPLLSVNVFCFFCFFRIPSIYNLHHKNFPQTKDPKFLCIYLYIYDFLQLMKKKYAVIYIEKIQIDRFLPLMF